MESQLNSKPQSIVFKLGKYTFEYPKDHSKKKPIHKEAIKTIQMDENDTLDISWGKYKRYKWHKVLKRVRDSEVERISAYGNSDKNIGKALSKISFYNLTYLDLGECQIENIEQLPVGPNLNYLSLINNYISSVKALKKFHIPVLKTLLLNDNPIKELGVERCDFLLETYWLQRKYNFKTIQECLGQTSLYKIKSEQVKDVSIESIGRIHQPNLILKIHDRFPNLQKLFYIQPQDLFESDTEFVVYMTDNQSEQDNANEILFQQIPIDLNQIPQPPALYFIEAEAQENWPNQMGKVGDELTNQTEGLKEKEEDLEDQEGSQEDQEESDQNDSKKSNQIQEEYFEKSSQKSSSCWDSGLEEEQIVLEQEGPEQQELSV